MRETLENNEPLEHAVHRGLEEEFGMEAEIIDYVGSIKSHSESKTGSLIQKTTLYFLCKEISRDDSKREKGMEGMSELGWKSIDFLIEKFKEQSVFKSGVVDDSEILERLKNSFLKKKDSV